MTDDDLCYMSATDAAARFRSRRLSPVELIDAIIGRSTLITETINPFTDCYFDEARARARESEALFLKNSIDVRPLEGIPLAVKDMCDIAGKRTTNCSLIDSENIPSETTPYVQRLIQTGANVFA